VTGARGRHGIVRAGIVGPLVAALAVAAATPAVADLDPPPAPIIEQQPASWPDPPEVAGPVHLLVDAATGQVLASERADEPRPVASTIKVLTALAAADRLELDQVVEVGDEVVGVPGASVELEPGERWTVGELLAGILVRSGNDAAEAVAAAAAPDRDGFIELMETTARDVGIDLSTPLVSVSGLEDDQQLSASDLATLARVLLADPELRAIVGVDEVTLPDREPDENRNLLVGDYPGATGVKTGFTEAAGNSLVGSARRGEFELVVVVLGGGPDPERFLDAAALLDHGFEAFAPAELSATSTLLVAGGERRFEVTDTPVVVPVGADAAIELPVPVRAPDEDTVEAPIVVDGVAVASVEASVTGAAPATVSGPAAIGRAVADGAYAALRADVARDGAPATRR
jgi:serine-type D-Ala-D-Ala carboxypeptidase (penicillin-binding protein 5/6)